MCKVSGSQIKRFLSSSMETKYLGGRADRRTDGRKDIVKPVNQYTPLWRISKLKYDKFDQNRYRTRHQISPPVVSLKGRLPQKPQSKSTFSVEIVQKHSLFCDGLMNKPKLRINK